MLGKSQMRPSSLSDRERKKETANHSDIDALQQSWELTAWQRTHCSQPFVNSDVDTLMIPRRTTTAILGANHLVENPLLPSSSSSITAD